MLNRGGVSDGGDELFEQLWKACAGPIVDVPHVGQRVFYFPQGHLEQLESETPTNEELNQKKILQFNLPNKILCCVLDVQLQAEKETDEVSARITLIPESNQTEPTCPDPCPAELPRPTVCSFCEVLTASDIRTRGGFPLKKHAAECLPKLSRSTTQELVAEDLHGHEWRFKHIVSGRRRRHFLTTGWRTFVTSKRLVAGDTFVFLRGDNGKLRVGVRHFEPQQSSTLSSVNSSQSTPERLLTTASDALVMPRRLVACHKTRMSQYIISVNKYLDAINNKFSVAMRFNMRFETDKRYSGTVVEVDDISPCWVNSHWRSLKVQWDEPASFPRPDRVSPWEIEPFLASVPTSLVQPAVAKNKRPRSPCEVQDLDTTLASSALGDAGLMQFDITQHSDMAHVKQKQNVMAENERSDGADMWLHEESDTNGKSNSDTNETEGSWQSSPPYSSGPSHLP